MIKGTYAEQKIKDAIQHLKEASLCLEDIHIASLQEDVEIQNNIKTIMGEANDDIIEAAMALKDLIE